MINAPTLGILGGGQLARMTAYAAFRLGLRVHVMEKFPDSPAGQIAHKEVVGDPSDHDLLLAFAAECDVVTLESEFVNEAHLTVLETNGHRLYPAARSVGRIQDKLLQKRTLEAAGIPVAPFRGVSSVDEARDFGREHGYPFLLKGRRDSYDGYGNVTIDSEEEVTAGWGRLTAKDAGRELYCEAFVPFVKELALMVTRSDNGEMILYPVVETVQENHICHLVTAPALIEESSRVAAERIGRAAVEAIDGIGIFGIELFMTGDGAILLNEMAPRPHNSGHYTIEGCITSQFENHVRAVMGWPLGAADLRAPGVAMANILGRRSSGGEVANYHTVLREPTAHLHIYGKAESRPGRKMGHVTALADSVEEAARIAQDVERSVNFGR